jgi:hypothetical protein
MLMSDGTEVPDECIRALDEVNDRWNGWVVIPQARADVIQAVLKAYRPDPGEFKPIGRWRVTDKNGSWWMESSSQQDCFESMRDGDRLQQRYEKREYEWRDEEV